MDHVISERNLTIQFSLSIVSKVELEYAVIIKRNNKYVNYKISADLDELDLLIFSCSHSIYNKQSIILKVSSGDHPIEC